MQGIDSLCPLGDHHARLATHCGLARRRGRNAGRTATRCLHALLCMKQYRVCGRALPDSVAYIKLALFLPHFFCCTCSCKTLSPCPVSAVTPGICSTQYFKARISRSLALVQHMSHIHRALGRSNVVMRDWWKLEGPCAWLLGHTLH